MKLRLKVCAPPTLTQRSIASDLQMLEADAPLLHLVIFTVNADASISSALQNSVE
jgi:hypothetical protein